MIESNELVTKDFNVDRDSIPFDEQKKEIFNELVGERSSEFKDLAEKLNPDNLIYRYKNEATSAKDFRNYRNAIELFKDLRDGNINQKKSIKRSTLNQI